MPETSLIANLKNMVVGRIDSFLPLPSHVDIVAVSTANNQWAKPDGCRWVIFSPVGSYNFAIRGDNAAVFPAGAVTDGTGSIPNPAQFDLDGVVSLGIIADASGYLAILCYG